MSKKRSPGEIYGERSLIEGIRARSKRLSQSKGNRIALGIGDDCAVLRPRRHEDLVVTTDFSLENVHFRRDWHPPESVGHRCLARGLSDLAAMGARPEAAFLSIALPASLAGAEPGSWLQGFLDGFLALAERHQVPLAGGDTAQAPGSADDGLVTADIVLVGSVPRGRALLRSGAVAGDILCVTGALGGSSAELRTLERKPFAFRGALRDDRPHLYPEPRLAAGRKLMKRGLATAAIDLSDGLSTDVLHLCEESGLAAEIDADSIPIDARSNLEQALHGGEDYELLFTVSRKQKIPAHLGGVLVHPIGRMKKPGKGPQVTLHRAGKSMALLPAGWEHFR